MFTWFISTKKMAIARNRSMPSMRFRLGTNVLEDGMAHTILEEGRAGLRDKAFTEGLGSGSIKAYGGNFE
jgi:hypothetical protein